MNSYPSTPGYRNQETSRQAALDFADKAPTIQSRVLQSIKECGRWYGATPSEVALALDIPEVNVRPRFTELKLKGLIVDSGDRRLSSYGKQQIVWVSNHKGE